MTLLEVRKNDWFDLSAIERIRFIPADPEEESENVLKVFFKSGLVCEYQDQLAADILDKLLPYITAA